MPLGDNSILSVLRLLEEGEHWPSASMARELGVSLGKTNYCLRALIAKVFIKVKSFRKSTHERGYLYLLTPEGAAASRANTSFLARKCKEYEALRAEIAPPA